MGNPIVAEPIVPLGGIDILCGHVGKVREQQLASLFQAANLFSRVEQTLLIGIHGEIIDVVSEGAFGWQDVVVDGTSGNNVFLGNDISTSHKESIFENIGSQSASACLGNSHLILVATMAVTMRVGICMEIALSCQGLLQFEGCLHSELDCLGVGLNGLTAMACNLDVSGPKGILVLDRRYLFHLEHECTTEEDLL